MDWLPSTCPSLTNRSGLLITASQAQPSLFLEWWHIFSIAIRLQLKEFLNEDNTTSQPLTTKHILKKKQSKLLAWKICSWLTNHLQTAFSQSYMLSLDNLVKVIKVTWMLPKELDCHWPWWELLMSSDKISWAWAIHELIPPGTRWGIR